MNLGILQKIGDMQSIMQNPQQALQGMMGNKMLMQNPIMNNAFQMAQSGNEKGLLEIAQNICKTNGKDFETEFANFKKQLGIH